MQHYREKRAKALTRAALLIEVIADRELRENGHAKDSTAAGDRRAFLNYQEARWMKDVAKKLRQRR